MHQITATSFFTRISTGINQKGGDSYTNFQVVNLSEKILIEGISVFILADILPSANCIVCAAKNPRKCQRNNFRKDKKFTF